MVYTLHASAVGRKLRTPKCCLIQLTASSVLAEFKCHFAHQAVMSLDQCCIMLYAVVVTTTAASPFEHHKAFLGAESVRQQGIKDERERERVLW